MTQCHCQRNVATLATFMKGWTIWPCEVAVKFEVWRAFGGTKADGGLMPCCPNWSSKSKYTQISDRHCSNYVKVWQLEQEAEAKASNENEDSAELVNERESWRRKLGWRVCSDIKQAHFNVHDFAITSAFSRILIPKNQAVNWQLRIFKRLSPCRLVSWHEYFFPVLRS